MQRHRKDEGDVRGKEREEKAARHKSGEEGEAAPPTQRRRWTAA